MKKRKPKLILLSGCPGVGKSTMSKMYVDRHPMALNLDIDTLWFMMGHWQKSRPVSHEQKMKLAYVVADTHLKSGFDVVVAQHLEKLEYHVEFAKIAKKSRATYVEIVLRNELDVAIERFIARGKATGHPNGFRPGGIMDTEGREQKIIQMHQQVEDIAKSRSEVIIIDVADGQAEATYQRIIDCINKKIKE